MFRPPYFHNSLFMDIFLQTGPTKLCFVIGPSDVPNSLLFSAKDNCMFSWCCSVSRIQIHRWFIARGSRLSQKWALTVDPKSHKIYAIAWSTCRKNIPVNSHLVNCTNWFNAQCFEFIARIFLKERYQFTRFSGCKLTIIPIISVVYGNVWLLFLVLYFKFGHGQHPL